MDMPKPLLIHKMFKCEPGSLPKWFISADNCSPKDAITVTEFACTITLVLICGPTLTSWLAAVICLALTELLFVDPIRASERKARARRHRLTVTQAQIDEAIRTETPLTSQ